MNILHVGLWLEWPVHFHGNAQKGHVKNRKSSCERDFLQNGVSTETSVASNSFKMTQITGQILNYFNCWWHITEEKTTQKTSADNVPGSPGTPFVYLGMRGRKRSLTWINERATRILKEKTDTSRIKERKESRISGKDFTVVEDVKISLYHLEELIWNLRLLVSYQRNSRIQSYLKGIEKSQENRIHH